MVVVVQMKVHLAKTSSFNSGHYELSREQREHAIFNAFFQVSIIVHSENFLSTIIVSNSTKALSDNFLMFSECLVKIVEIIIVFAKH